MATHLDTEKTVRRPFMSAEAVTWLVTGLLVILGSFVPTPAPMLALEAAKGFLALLPVIGVAALLAGWLSVADWSDRVVGWIGASTVRSVVIASLAGAITPVCGLGVLPLIAALLRRGIPLAPVLAFWVSSPITDPAMLVVTAGILGIPFAVAKTVSALGIGLLAGGITAALPGFSGPGHRFMRADQLAAAGCCENNGGILRESWSNARLVARWLALAVVLEVLLQHHVPAAWIEQAVGGDNPASIPLAAIVGAPLYLDGYAALPLVRGLIEMGMSPGAALALLISGAAVSVYALVAVISLVRARVLILYIVLAVLGACLAGYSLEWIGRIIDPGWSG
jgi:uncharacterized membrane protein YraQ (UPF0718 family)